MNSKSNSGLRVSYNLGVNKIAISINVIISIACLVGAYHFYSETQNFLDSAEITTGEVIRFNESRRDGETRYNAVFQFSLDSGATIEFPSNTSSNRPSHSVGDLVEILYHPDAPENARLNSTFGLYGFTIILGILGAAGFLFFAANQVNLRKRKELAIHLSTFGKPYETKFTGVKRVTRGKNNRYQYYITSSYVFDDITREFRSEVLLKNPEMYEDMPETITVVADPNDLSKYAMDISFLPDDTFKPTVLISTRHGQLQV